jgi:hypothetical protein
MLLFSSFICLSTRRRCESPGAFPGARSPVAIGLNEVSNQRTSLGAAVIGGVVSSTVLTLIVIPAVFTYMEWLREKLLKIGGRFVTKDSEPRANGHDSREATL